MPACISCTRPTPPSCSSTSGEAHQPPLISRHPHHTVRYSAHILDQFGGASTPPRMHAHARQAAFPASLSTWHQISSRHLLCSQRQSRSRSTLAPPRARITLDAAAGYRHLETIRLRYTPVHEKLRASLPRSAAVWDLALACVLSAPLSPVRNMSLTDSRCCGAYYVFATRHAVARCSETNASTVLGAPYERMTD